MRKGKKKRKVVEVKDSEDWCFACKDGGQLILCDYGGCVKVYHAECVGREGSGGATGERWTCDRHSCLECHNKPWFHCYCCPNSVCRRCVRRARFLPIRGRNGLCDECWELVRIVEGDEEPPEEIDLNDRETYECLFKEYWDITKEKVGLTMEDIYSADARSKKRSCRSKSDKVDRHEDDDDSTSNNDSDDDSERCGDGKRKGNDESNSFGNLEGKGNGGGAKKKNAKGLEFVGWGSKPLIDFLVSLGKDKTVVWSQEEVESTICEYVQEKKLWDGKNKKKIVCDEKLYSVIRRKSVHKNSLSRFLEPHFAADMDPSDESDKEEFETISHSKNGFTALTKKPKTDSSKKSRDVEAEIKYEESCYASIVAENIKLVYLKRSLVEELSREPEVFEAKVVGSFVRVKNDPKDYLKRNSHQLFLVKGIKQITKPVDSTTEFHIQVYDIPTNVHVSTLSDCDFEEEEIEDLRQRIEKGLLPKILVVDLEEKARCLHKDVTKHWIQKELDRLQNRIDFANEKGWRRETVADYLATRESLKNVSEQERLLRRSPKVIAERVACNNESANALANLFKRDESPKSILRGDDGAV